MQTAAFGTASGYLRWPSRSARLAFPRITTSGTSSRWAAGHSPRAHDIAATYLAGTVAMALFRFVGHFMLAKAVLLDQPQSRMSGLVFLLRLIPFQYVERFFQSHPHA